MAGGPLKVKSIGAAILFCTFLNVQFYPMITPHYAALNATLLGVLALIEI